MVRRIPVFMWSLGALSEGPLFWRDAKEATPLLAPSVGRSLGEHAHASWWNGPFSKGETYVVTQARILSQWKCWGGFQKMRECCICSWLITHICPQGPSTNRKRSLSSCIGNYPQGLSHVVLIQLLGPADMWSMTSPSSPLPELFSPSGVFAARLVPAPRNLRPCKLCKISTHWGIPGNIGTRMQERLLSHASSFCCFTTTGEHGWLPSTHRRCRSRHLLSEL